MASPAPRSQDLFPVALSGVLAAAVVVLGVRLLVAGHIMGMFSLAIAVVGAVALALAIQTWRGSRTAWAFLVALWGVVAFCAFFAAPEVVALDHLKQVTPEMELSLGREKAEQKIDDENMNIRLTNLGVSTLFAAPFVVACVVLARRGRDVVVTRT